MSRPPSGPGGGGTSGVAHRDAVGERHLQRPRAHDLGAVRRQDRGLGELDAAARPYGLGGDGELTDRHRPQELVGDAGDRQTLGRGQSLERAHQQRGRRTAVLGAGVPRTTGQFGGDESSVLRLEYRHFGHGQTR